MNQNKGLNLVQKTVRSAPIEAAKTKANLLLDGFDAPFTYDEHTLDVGMASKTNDYKTKSSQVRANVGWVFAANDIIAEGISAVEFVVQETKRGEIVTHEEHPLLTLLDSPVDNMHGMQFLNLHSSYLNLNGESYIIPSEGVDPKTRLPYALHILPAHQVEYKIEAKTGNEIIKFGNDEYLENTAKKRTFYRDYRANVESAVRGKSIVGAAAAAIDTDDKAKRYNQNFFANAARPSLVIESDKVMTPEAYRRYKQQLTEYQVGTENAYKPMLLEGGAQAKPFALSQKDMDFLQGRKFSMDEILAMFRISPAMLGMITAANRANMEAAEYNFAKWVILPRVKAFCKFVNKYIIDPIDPTLKLSYKPFVPDDVTTQVTKTKAAVNVYKTINEVRKEEGLEDIDGGDQLYVAGTLVAIGQPVTPVAAPAVTPEPNEPEPEAGESEQELENKRLKKQMAKMILRHKAELKKKLLNDVIAQRDKKGMARVNKMMPLLDRYEAKFMEVSRAHFEKQRQDVLNVLIEAMPAARKSLHKTKGVKDQLQMLFANSEYNIDLSEQLQPVYQALMAAQIVDTFAQLPGYQAPQDVPGISEFIKNRAGMIAKDIDAETQKQVLLTLAEGFDAGEDRTALTARLNKIFGDAASIRSERIARTESTKAAAQADLYGWKHSGLVIGKEWYTPALDACPYCRSMDRKSIGLDEDYFKIGDKLTVDYVNAKGEKKSETKTFKYEDVQAPPVHVNCRCTILPVLKSI